jgi:hypothetical protein
VREAISIRSATRCRKGLADCLSRPRTAIWKGALRHIVEQEIARDSAHRFVPIEIARALTDHDAELDLAPPSIGTSGGLKNGTRLCFYGGGPIDDRSIRETQMKAMLALLMLLIAVLVVPTAASAQCPSGKQCGRVCCP